MNNTKLERNNKFFRKQIMPSLEVDKMFSQHFTTFQIFIFSISQPCIFLFTFPYYSPNYIYFTLLIINILLSYFPVYCTLLIPIYCTLLFSHIMHSPISYMLHSSTFLYTALSYFPILHSPIFPYCTLLFSHTALSYFPI